MYIIPNEYFVITISKKPYLISIIKYFSISEFLCCIYIIEKDKFTSKIKYNTSEVSYGVVKDLEILLRKFQCRFFMGVFRYIFAIKSINKKA